MRYALSKSALLSGAFLLGFGGSALAQGPYYSLDWHRGSGGSCLDTCERAGAKVVVSGQYRGLPSPDQSFTVCKANAKHEGDRVGFNIVSSGPRCRVAHGDQGLKETEYACLCATETTTVSPRFTFEWGAAGGGSCIDYCKRKDQEAVKAGQYKGFPSEDQSFTVCRGAFLGGGRRVGFNIVSSGARCRFAYGDEGRSGTEFDCLCRKKVCC